MFGHSELFSETMDTFKEKELDMILQGSSFLLSIAQAKSINESSDSDLQFVS